MDQGVQMTEENKKTIIAFIAGLLVGGLLVFIFAEPAGKTVEDNDVDVDTVTANEEDEGEADLSAEPEETSEETSSDTDSDGEVSVADQEAGDIVRFSASGYPENVGWIGVRDYVDGRLSGLLGVVRWDLGAGLRPSEVKLLRPTEAGKTYAIVFYKENGDRVFSLATDAQMSGVMETFKAK